MLTLVGTKIGKIIATVLAAILILFIMIQYIQFQERDRITQEIKTEVLQNRVDTIERVQDAVKEVRRINPNSDGAIALDRLRDRQSNN